MKSPQGAVQLFQENIMYDIELHIKTRDWLYIVGIGVVLATLLSLFGYRLLSLPVLDGGVLGAMLGLGISLLSLLFISTMNHYVLPGVRRRFWLPIAVFFSFLAGFLGTMIAVTAAKGMHLALIVQFHDETLQIAAIIGLLTYMVGALLYRFVQMRNEKERIDQMLTESRLRSLETQLNPHFLFNALNSVAELIHHDPVKAEMAVMGLSNFLRNTMSEASLIPLHEELRNVRAYLELENIRFGGIVRYDESIMPQAAQWEIPKFSIQLLAENAIKHGFDPRKEILHIRVRSEAGRIVISNDGRPIERSGRAGIGLQNLRERLKYLCGGSLTITSYDPPIFTIDPGECHDPADR